MLRGLMAGLLMAAWAAGGAAQNEVPTGYSIFGWAAEEIVEPYAPDRARATPFTTAVPVGRFAIEAGATYTYNNDNDIEVQNWTVPELLIRGGIFSQVELRIGWDGQSTTEIDSDVFSDTSSGVTDASVGIKVELWENMSLLPAAAVLGQITIPVGSDDFTSDRVDPSAQIALAYDEIHDIVSLFGSAEIAFLEDSMDESVERIGVTAGTGQQWNDQVYTFVEFFAFLENPDGVDDAYFLQGGGIFEAAPNVVIDARIGFGLTDEAADVFVGFGGSLSL